MYRLCVILLLMSLVNGDSHESPFSDDNHRTCLRVEHSCYPSASQISKLDTDITGDVLVKTDADYTRESLMYNRNTQQYPGIVVMVESVEDIRAAILFARQYRLRVSIRSSGHDYSGRSTWIGSLNINLDRMTKITVNLTSTRNQNGEVKVESGAELMDLYKKVDAVDRIVLSGSAHTVAAGGYTLGGGHSPISRTYGYAVDNLLETQVVLADGTIATCNSTHTHMLYVNGTEAEIADGDLFWALQGGGGGTFGVSVYFVYELHPASKMVTISSVMLLKVDIDPDTERTKNFFNAVHDLVNKLPSSYGGYYLSNNYPGNYEGIAYEGSLSLFMNKMGTWQEEDNGLWKDMFALLRDKSTPYSVTNSTSFLEYEKAASDPSSSRTILSSSLIQPSGVSALTDFIINQFFDKFHVGSDIIWLGCTGVLLGGKTKEPAADATPLHPGYRTATTNLVCGVVLVDPADPNYPPETNAIIRAKAEGLGLDMATLGQGMYFNEPTMYTTMWKEEFWGSNYQRLLSIKVRYDPENYFTCPRCVGDEFNKHGSASGSVLVLPSVATLILTVFVML